MSQGASTLTQQLARAVFLTPEKTWARKINEVFLTVEIEKQFSKDQILTLYLNKIPFGHGTYGVEAASRWYFGHGAKTLSLPEAALLAGIIQRPAYYSPFNNVAAAKNRRDLVLRRMAEEGFLTDAQRVAAQGTPVDVIRSSRETTLGLYFCEEVRQYLEKEYGEGDLYREGLRVDTTLDPRLETWAEEALRRGLRRVDRRSGFRKPRNLVAEGIDPEKYRDPSWAGGRSPSDTLTAVVLQASKTGAEVRVGTKRFTVPAAAFRWTRAESPAKAVQRGDVIQIETSLNDAGKEETLVAQDPHVEGRGRHPGKRNRRGARAHRRIRLQPLEIRPRRAGPAAGGLRVQARRLPGGHRAGLHARGHGARRAALDRHRPEAAALGAAELRAQVSGHRDVPVRPRAFPERRDRARRTSSSARERSSRRRAASESARTSSPIPRSPSALSR